jgi:rhodanese-related sulfurtransferase
MKSKVIGLGFIVFVLGMATSVYAQGEIYPIDAYGRATTEHYTYILDVRTAEEWKWVGHPGLNNSNEGGDLEGKVINIPVSFWEDDQFVPNKKFLKKVKNLFPDKSVELIIMDKSGGVRSNNAYDILEAEGYTVYKMLEGFQGTPDTKGYFTVNGWMNDPLLPYTYVGAGYTK